MLLFKRDRVIPGAAIVNLDIVAFNVEEDEVEDAVAVILETLITTVYVETNEMPEIFE